MLFRLFPLVSLFCASLVLASVSLGAFETTSKQAILVDVATGTVLFEKNADDRMAPSSMSKMMTIYQVFDALKEGSLSLDDKFLVSEKAWRKAGFFSPALALFAAWRRSQISRRFCRPSEL